MKKNIGEKYWLVKTPFLMIHHQRELEGGPQLYEIIDTYFIHDENNPSYKLKNLKTGWILFYGDMSGPEWQSFQGDLFDDNSN